jgi:hypothetical protein
MRLKPFNLLRRLILILLDRATRSAQLSNRRSPQTCDLADRCYRQSNKPVLSRSSGRFAGPEHDDFRADRRAVVEIDDVLVRQADTAGRDVGANGPGFIGAVDAVCASLLPLQRYMARAPSGLSGPPFMPMPLRNCTMCWRSSGLRASISAGGYQSGHSCLL